MAAKLPTPQSSVLEDDDAALFPEPQIGADEEVVNLNEHAGDSAAAPAKPAGDSAAAPAKPAAPAPAADDEIPEQYRGKTPAQLAKMLVDSQSLIGRQGQELGEWRRRVDQFVQADLASRSRPAEPAKPAEEPKKIEDADFFAQPMDAVQRAIAESPVIKEIRAALGKSAQDSAVERAMAAKAKFDGAHPDATAILADPEFRNWVEASSVRRELLFKAHRNYDFAAGDEVFGTWKALKGIGKPAPKPAEPSADEAAAAAASEAGRQLAARKRDLSAAKVPTDGNGTAAPGGGGSKKIFRRADVIKLMEENPERYEQLAPEIEQAYRENRVR